MKVLVINCGSSSLKYQLIDSETEQVLAKGLCERIGIDGRLTHRPTGKDKVVLEDPLPNHTAAVSAVLGQLTDPVNGVIADLKEIGAVGHRIVHGGEKFASSTVLTDEVVAEDREVQRSGTSAQPGKPDRYQCMQGADARRTYGWRIRYRIPSDHAEEGFPVWSSLRVL